MSGTMLLPIHIIGGSIAIIAGFISVFAVKGLKLHRKSGMVFVYSMVVLSLTGALAAEDLRVNEARCSLSSPHNWR